MLTGLPRFGDAQRLGHLRRQHAQRPIHHARGLPCGIVETRFAPPGLLHPRVVFFAVVFVVGANRPGGSQAPGPIGDHRRRRAILIFDIQLQNRLGIAVRARALLRPRRAVPPVPQPQPHRIAPRRQRARHVEGLVEHVPVIIREPRRKHVVPDLRPVQPQLGKPQPRVVNHRPPHPPLHQKFLAQHPRRQPVLGHKSRVLPRLHAERAQVAGSLPRRIGESRLLPSIPALRRCPPIVRRAHNQRLAGIEIDAQRSHQPRRRIVLGVFHFHRQHIPPAMNQVCHVLHLGTRGA